MRTMCAALLVSALIGTAGLAWAADEIHWETTDFLDFQLSKRWTCDGQKPLRSCQDARPDSKKDAMLSFAGRPARPNQTLEGYLGSLKHPKVWHDENGGTVASHVINSEIVTIGGQPWVRSVHDESELRGYRTRYMVTIKDGWVVVITLTGRFDRFEDYEKDLEQGMQTVRLKVPAH